MGLAPRRDARLDLQVGLDVVGGQVGRGATDLPDARAHALAQALHDRLLEQLVRGAPQQVPGARLDHLGDLEIEELSAGRPAVPVVAIVVAAAVVIVTIMMIVMTMMAILPVVMTAIVVVPVIVTAIVVVTVVVMTVPVVMTRTAAPVVLAHGSHPLRARR